MKTMRQCYNQLPKKDAETLKAGFLLEFGCSLNTFYRVLNDPTPLLKYLVYCNAMAGFAYNFEKSEFYLDSQNLRKNIARRHGLTLNA